MKHRKSTRLLALLLMAAMLMGLITVPAGAAPAEGAESETVSLPFEEVDSSRLPDTLLEEANVIEEDFPSVLGYTDSSIVRVSIFLEDDSTIDAGFAIAGIAEDSAAIAYREQLEKTQEQVAADIESVISGALDVKWNLTLAANLISANVEYSDIETIEEVPGVASVAIENRYDPAVLDTEETADPSMATSSKQIGSAAAYAEGYTGAGSRIAVIDTGIDSDHQSFSEAGLNDSLARRAEQADMEVSEYLSSLNLLDAEEIESKLSQLNISSDYSADELYVSAKIPFAFNYIDGNLDITHDNDTQGEHGSHVEGIAAANAYIPNEDGSFSAALDTVKTQGVAPDAQLIVMKVFGSGGGAYESDYMAAIEDAVILGADSINLSLGSASSGFHTHSIAQYQAIMDSLTEHGAVVAVAAGNAYDWTYYAYTDGLYADDVSFDRVSSPASFANSMAVASVDNVGSTANTITLADGASVAYTETGSSNEPLSSLNGEQEYVLIDGYGTESEFAAIADVLEGKIAVCSRGGNLSFTQKAEAAVENGAIAVIVYNNTSGTIKAVLSDYTRTAPVVTVTQAHGALLKSSAAAVLDESGAVRCYTGVLTVNGTVSTLDESEYYTMSAFSSWGVPGSLTLKPEITAPGRSIYSVDGSVAGGKAYETMSGTSMATPQVSGMVAVAAQYIRENHLTEKTGLSVRQLAQSLLMSTAEPVLEEASGGSYYSVLKQGAGLANVGEAVTAQSYILMDAAATDSAADGKVKAELGDDPDRTGVYQFSFTLNSLSDQNLSYSLSGDFFTQGIAGEYLDTKTIPVAAELSFTVDGTPLVPQETGVNCDLDHDGDTDANDAQIILNYVVGLTGEIEEIADVDGDGGVTTYDAWLILSDLSTRAFTVEAGKSAAVTVTVRYPEAVKEYLNANYVNGAYVEGYVYATPIATAEGVIPDAVHSIPVLGFYGNWTDPSMYEPVSYTKTLYGDTTQSYTGVTATNNLIYRASGSTATYYQVGNPYIIEDEYPAGREAIRSSDTIYQYQFSLLRNAAAVVGYVTDENGNFLYIGDISRNVYGEYSGLVLGLVMSWFNKVNQYNYYKLVSELGVKEGDRITVGLAAVPEYYAQEGALTEDQLKQLISEDALGRGAYLATTMTVDDTAPTVIDITRNLETGAVTVTAQDNQYIAAIELLNSSGTTIYAAAVPEQTAAGNTVSYYFSPEDIDNLGNRWMVLVADYAGNRTIYRITTNEEVDYSGGFFVFSNSGNYNYLGSTGTKHLRLDPLENTMEVTDFMDFNVTAAEYVNGYVYMAADDGCLYTAKLGFWNEYEKVGYYKSTTAVIRDMAYSYADGKLYALDGTTGDKINYIYSIDLTSGALTEEFTVVPTNPYNNTNAIYKDFMSMTIDDDGNFYAVSYTGASSSSGGNITSYLYTWSADDIERSNGAITDLPCITNSRTGYIGWNSNYNGSSLAWDHDEDALYWVNSAYSTSNLTGYLWRLDVETGKATKIMTAPIQGKNIGLYIVPEQTGEPVDPTEQASEITISQTTATLLENSSSQLTAEVFPWTLTNKTVTWASSDESIVAVDQDGRIAGVKAGTAVVTATTNAAPHLTASCTVTVKHVDNIRFSGLFTESSSSSYWTEFNSENFEIATPVHQEPGSYTGGTLLDGLVYVRDGSNNLYSVDPDTFEVRFYGAFDSTYAWVDAAAAPTVETASGSVFFGFLVIPYRSNNQQKMMLLDPDNGLVKTVSVSTLNSNPIVAIAYAGETTQGTKAYPAHVYYLLTENGTLYTYTWYASSATSYLTTGLTLAANTGLQLPGAYQPSTSWSTSMIYDQQTQMLLLATNETRAGSTTTAAATTLYAIDPATGLYAVQGESDGLLTSLYQHERVTELTVQISPARAEIYEEDTVELSARVLPTIYQNKVIWSSSDPTVAAVDQNGVVTGVGGGTAVITATSVEQDANGNHASASSTVTVTALRRIYGSVNAQVADYNGAYWSTINTADLHAFTNDQGAEVVFQATAVYDGKIYGIGADNYLYQVDPYDNFSAVQGPAVSYTMVIDGTVAPKASFPAQDANGETITVEAFGCPVFLVNKYYIEMLTDFETGATVRLPVASTIGLGICYMGTAVNDDGIPVEKFLVSSSTMMYLCSITPAYNAETGAVTYTLTKEYVYLNHSFSGCDSATMTYVDNGMDRGIMTAVVKDGTVEFWFTDLSIESWVAKTYYDSERMGILNGAVGISGLYAAPAEADLDALEEMFTLRQPTDEEPSPWIPMETTIEALLAASAEIFPSVESSVFEAPADFAVNAVTGFALSLRGTETAAQPAPAVAGTEAAAKDGVVTLTLVEDKSVTNGLIRVTYDPAVLTYVNTATAATIHAVNNDPQKGELLFDYASAKAIQAGSVLAALTFTYTDLYIDTEIVLETLERSHEITVTGEKDAFSVTDEIGEHNYEITETVDATCEENGYITYTCTICGDTYTEVIPALGHDYVVTAVVEPTVTTGGYIVYECTRCGDRYYSWSSPAAGPAQSPAQTHTHTPGEAVRENEIAATETTAGSYDRVVYCTECGAELSRTAVTIPILSCPSAPFTDVDTSLWYHEAIDYAITNGLLTGVGDNQMNPTGDMTRSMFVTVLYRMAGAPKVTGSVPFTDLTDTWYQDAVLWAYQNKITDGTSDTTFSPDAKVTREQMATFLFRYTKLSGFDVDGVSSVKFNSFADCGSVDGWAAEAMIWATDTGVINGTGAGLEPLRNTSRAECAQMFMNYLKMIAASH